MKLGYAELEATKIALKARLDELHEARRTLRIPPHIPDWKSEMHPVLASIETTDAALAKVNEEMQGSERPCACGKRHGPTHSHFTPIAKSRSDTDIDF